MFGKLENDSWTKAELLEEIDRLRARLDEAERRQRLAARQEAVAKELRASGLHHRLLTDLLARSAQPFGFCYADGRPGGVNAAFEELTGYSGEELRRLDWRRDLTPSRWHALETAKLEELARNGRPVRYEKEYLRKDGSLVPVELFAHLTTDEAGAPQYHYFFLTDLTERKAMERALQASEERFRDIARASADWIWEIDRDGRYIYASEGVTETLGYQVEEVLGRSPFDLMPAAEVERLRGRFAAIVERQAAFRDLENVNRHKDGSLRHILTNGMPFFDAQGELLGYRGVDKDITGRKQAEALLVDAMQRLEKESDILQAVINVATNMHLAYLDCDFNFVRVNETYARSCGYRPEEMVGMNHFALYPHPENEAIFAQVRDSGQPVSYHDKPFTFPDQPERGVTYWDWLLAPVIGPHAQMIGLVFSLFETTESKRVEESLRQKSSALEAAKVKAENDRRLLATVLATLPTGVALIDLEGGCLQANSAFERVWGGPRPETKSVADYTLYQGWWLDSDRLVAPEEWASAVVLRTGKAVDGQLLRIRRFDGSEAVIINSASPIHDVEGKLVGCAVAIHDITELKRAEDSLRASEALFRGVFQSAAVGIVKSSREGYIQLANDAFCRMAGRPRAELIGRHTLEITHPEDVLPNAELLRRAATGEIKDYSLEKRYLRRDGSNMWVNVTVTEVEDEEGHHLHNIAVVEDIAERKASEERLRASLHEKEVLLKEIHHRVKNNLQVISSLVDLQADNLNDPALTGVFQDMRDRVRSMALVHETLYCSEGLADVDFAEYIGGLLHYLWSAHRSETAAIDLRLDLRPVRLGVESAVPCGLIVNELAINALKHAFGGRDQGEVVVRLASGPEGEVRLSIADNGVGLSADLNWRETRSLGLNLVRMLARQLKATVEVTSRGGTEFRLVFKPRAATALPE